jgi:protein-L-isoaspartate(D-aspartate) O-methyltransferase
MTDPHARMIAEIETDARDTAAWTGRKRLSRRVIDAMRQVPRDVFVPPERAEAAYANAPLPIGRGQTISQPFVVALMTDLLELESGDAVLEIGTGSGYQAAVLAELGAQVYSVEVIAELSERAAAALARAGYGDVALRVGDGGLGWPEHAPYDAIIVTAAAVAIPPALVEQLRLGGRMVIPLGPRHGEQELLLVEKDADGITHTRHILPVAFVPLTGANTRQ